MNTNLDPKQDNNFGLDNFDEEKGKDVEKEIEVTEEDLKNYELYPKSSSKSNVLIFSVLFFIFIIFSVFQSFYLINRQNRMSTYIDQMLANFRKSEVTTVESKEVKEEEEDIYYLGVLPLRNPVEMLERFSGVEKYLREETGLNIKLRLYPTSGALGGYSAVVKDIANGDISFAYLASVTTVQANGNGPVIPFACAQKDGSPTYQGDLVVKQDSPYQELSDLEGKKVSGTSVSSTSGNLMPLAWLKSLDIDSTTYFDGGMMYLGSHDKAAEAVLRGTIAGAFINEATENKFNEEEVVLRSIWQHDPVPEFPFVANLQVVSAEDLAKVKNALLKMHETDLEGVQAVNPNYEKWVAIDWEDYLSIKDAIDNVHGEVFYDLTKWGQE